MGKKILLVDDDPVIMKLAGARLKESGYDVISATNGVQGLDKAKNEKPELIITDALMPEMGGFEFLKELKKDETLAKIPIIVLSERKKMGDTFLAFGVKDFLPKPYDHEAVLNRIQSYLGPMTDGEASQPAESAPEQKEVVKQEAPAVEEKKEETKQEAPAPEEKKEEVKQEAPPPQEKKEEVKEEKKQDIKQEKKESLDIRDTRILLVGNKNTTINEAKKKLMKYCGVLAVERISDIVILVVEYKPKVLFLDMMISNESTHMAIASLRKLKEFKKMPIVIFNSSNEDDKGDVSIHQWKLDMDKAKTAVIDSGANEFIGDFNEANIMSNIEKYKKAG